MESELNTEFPDIKNRYLKAADFQDNEQRLLFKGWQKKANEDDPADRKNPKTWKDKLDYQLPYTYPEFARDKAGDTIMGKDGEPLPNRYYDANFPQGYSIKYVFEEGELDSGSKPLFETFSRLRPKVGELLSIIRTGEGIETQWIVRKVSEPLPEFDVDQLDKIDVSEA